MRKPYEHRLNSIRKTYKLNIEPQITNEFFHEEFFTSLDGLALLLEDGQVREAKQEIKRQMKLVFPYDNCELLHDTYQSILESLRRRKLSETNSTKAKDKAIVARRAKGQDQTR